MLGQVGDVRPAQELLRLKGQGEHALEGRQLAVDGPVLGPFLLAPVNVRADCGSGNVDGLPAGEVGFQVVHVSLARSRDRLPFTR